MNRLLETLKRSARVLLRRTPYEVRRRARSRSQSREAESREAEFELALTAVSQVRPYSMVHEQALVTLYRQVAHCEAHSIRGSLVECGVWKGGAAALMAIATMRNGGQRDLHLFDSFEGIPEPRSDIDGERAVREVGGAANAQGRLRVAWDYRELGGPGTEHESLALLEAVGYDRSFVQVHKGWFQETLPRDAPSIGPIAVLHLDADWYESTRLCLTHLYDKVVPGGFIMIDDYGCYDGCRTAVDAFLTDVAPVPFLHVVNGEVRYLEKPR